MTQDLVTFATEIIGRSPDEVARDEGQDPCVFWTWSKASYSLEVSSYPDGEWVWILVDRDEGAPVTDLRKRALERLAQMLPAPDYQYDGSNYHSLEWYNLNHDKRLVVHVYNVGDVHWSRDACGWHQQAGACVPYGDMAEEGRMMEAFALAAGP